MKEKIEIAIKTVENSMENLANTLDYLKGIQSMMENMQVVEQGEWEEISPETAVRRCSKCGARHTPSLYCKSCGSRNINRQNA